MIARINKLSDDLYSLQYDCDASRKLWERERKNYQLIGDEQNANLSWLALQIIDIHTKYRGIYITLNANNPNIKKYYDAWCDAEQIEIIAGDVKRNFPTFYKTIEPIVDQIHVLQSLYPYKLFSSSEILIEEEKCSICNTVRDFRNPCGHIKGYVYGGNLCCNIVTKHQVLGLALVTNPVKKYAVLFQQDKQGNEIEYNYNYIDALMCYWGNPYHFWNYYIRDNVIGTIIHFYKI